MKKYLQFNELMKTMMFVVLIGMTVVTVNAQEIKVRSINHLTTDITARSAVRMDDNNKECAIVRVNIPSLKTMDFGNSVVGGVEYNAGEYILYVPEGTIQISLSVDGYKDSKIDFSQYDISVEGKNVYRVTLYIDNGEQSSNEKHGGMAITTEPISAFVLMDGMPLGQTPLTLKDVSVGEHVLSFPNTDGYTLPDQTITIKENATFEKHYVLNEKDNDFSWVWDNVEYSEELSEHGHRIPLKYRMIKDGSKEGLQDYWGNCVVPCGKFDYVDAMSFKDGNDELFEVGDYDKDGNLLLGIYKPGKGLITPCRYGFIHYLDFTYKRNLIGVFGRNWNGCRLAAGGDAEGFINRKGKEVVPCDDSGKKYYYGDGDIIRCHDEKNNIVYLMSTDGKRITDDYNEITGSMGEGFVGVRMGKNNLIINYKGQIVQKLSSQYRFIGHTKGLFLLNKQGFGYGVCKSDFNQKLTEFIYEEVDYCKQGWVQLMKRNDNDCSWLVIDKNEHIYKVNCSDDDKPLFVGEYVLFKALNGKYGMYDQNGNIVLRFKYDKIDIIERNNEKGHYVVAYKDEQVTIFDNFLRELLTFDVTESLKIELIKDDIILLYDEASERYGFMSVKGEILAGCLFDFNTIQYIYSAHNMDEYRDNLICHGLALLCIGDRCGFVDKDGKVVVPLIYSIIVPFGDGTVYGLKPDGTWVDLKLENYNK